MATGEFRCSSSQHLIFPAMDSPSRDQDIGEWKKCISIVSNSVTSLENALDLMDATVNSTMRNRIYQDFQDISEEHGDKKSLKETHSLSYLQMCIERTVLHEGRFALTTVSNFIHKIIGAIAQISEVSADEFKQLSIDAHNKQYKETDNGQTSRVGSLDMLFTENSGLMEEKERLQRQISVFTEKEEELLKENDNLREEIENLEKCKDKEQMNSKQFEDRIADLEKDLKKLRSEYKKTGLSEMSIEVLKKKNEEVMIHNRKLQKELDESLKRYSNEKDNEIEENKKTIADLRSEVDILDNSVKTKNMEITSAEKYNKKANQTIEELQKENKELQKEMKEKNCLIDVIKANLREKENSYKNLESEMFKLSVKYKDIKSEMGIERENNRKLNEENAATIKKLKMQTEEDCKELRNIDRLQQKYNELQERHDDINDKLQTKDRKMNELQTKLKQIEILESENMKMKEQHKQFTKRLTLEKDSLSEELQNEKTNHHHSMIKNKDLNKKIDALSSGKEDLEARLSQAEETIQILTNDNDHLTKKISKLSQELELYKRKKLIQVQLYYQRRGELITTVEEELTRILKRRIEATGKTEIVFVKCAHTSDVNPELPLLLLCICASRIGTDAANTIQGLQLSSKMSLLIFHHKDIHALPSQASYQVLTGGEFKTMSGIFDLAFLSGKGIYSCPLNDNSIDKIVTFINTESLPGYAYGLSR